MQESINLNVPEDRLSRCMTLNYLTKEIYDYNTISAVREIIANALDANIEAKKYTLGKQNKVRVSFERYNDTTQQIIIQDFGFGMNRNIVENVFVNLTRSTKRQEVEGVAGHGGWGIGSKAVIAVIHKTDIPVTIETTAIEKQEDDMATTTVYEYVVNKSEIEMGEPQLNVISVTQDKSMLGTLVKIPLPNEDLLAVYQMVLTLYKLNEESIELVSTACSKYLEIESLKERASTCNNISTNFIYDTEELVKTLDERTKWYSGARSIKLIFKVGAIPYEYDPLANNSQINNYVKNNEEIMSWLARLKGVIVHSLGVNDIVINLNRENLNFEDEDTKNYLETFFSNLLERLKENVSIGTNALDNSITCDIENSFIKDRLNYNFYSVDTLLTDWIYIGGEKIICPGGSIEVDSYIINTEEKVIIKNSRLVSRILEGNIIEPMQTIEYALRNKSGRSHHNVLSYTKDINDYILDLGDISTTKIKKSLREEDKKKIIVYPKTNRDLAYKYYICTFEPDKRIIFCNEGSQEDYPKATNIIKSRTIKTTKRTIKDPIVLADQYLSKKSEFFQLVTLTKDCKTYGKIELNTKNINTYSIYGKDYIESFLVPEFFTGEIKLYVYTNSSEFCTVNNYLLKKSLPIFNRGHNLSAGYFFQQDKNNPLLTDAKFIKALENLNYLSVKRDNSVTVDREVTKEDAESMFTLLSWIFEGKGKTQEAALTNRGLVNLKFITRLLELNRDKIDEELLANLNLMDKNTARNISRDYYRGNYSPRSLYIYNSINTLVDHNYKEVMDNIELLESIHRYDPLKIMLGTLERQSSC